MNDLQAFADGLATSLMRTYQIPGLAAGAVLDGTPVWHVGYGTTRLGSADPVTSRTLFHLASVTKPFVATAILQLVERGQVDLDAPFSSYVPTFDISDPRGRAISIRQLLTHTAGLPDVMDYGWAHPEFDDGALERYIASLSTVHLLFAPGERFSYSDMGFDILEHSSHAWPGAHSRTTWRKTYWSRWACVAARCSCGPSIAICSPALISWMRAVPQSHCNLPLQQAPRW